jgi:hypothetical protein
LYFHSHTKKFTITRAVYWKSEIMITNTRDRIGSRLRKPHENYYGGFLSRLKCILRRGMVQGGQRPKQLTSEGSKQKNGFLLEVIP